MAAINRRVTIKAAAFGRVSCRLTADQLPKSENVDAACRVFTRHKFCCTVVFPPPAAGTDEVELIPIDVDDRGGGVDKARGGQ